MKRLTSLAMVFLLVLLPAIPAEAKQPLYGEMQLDFNPGWGGPSTTVPEWTGTIAIGDGAYGMAFFNIGSGKPFVDPFTGNVLFFGEIWVIYQWLTFDNGVLDHGEVLLWGTDQGVVTFANSKYRMNGKVEAASEIFAEWEGRIVHMSGIIVWDTSGPVPVPVSAPGRFRIN